MGLTVGYETKNGLEIKKKYGQNVQNTQQNKTNSIKQQTSASVASLGNSPASDSFTGGITGNVGSGNTCTDGKDDGHISLFSKVANVAQGVVRSGANIIKAAVKHPVKALAMTAVGFVPVVGPAVLGGLAVYGAVQGAKEVVGAINLANSATNDADAKAAWEHIGSGAFTTALSVTGAKASAKSLNNQLTGGSSTVNAFRKKGLSKETLSEAFKETKSNAKGFYDTAKAKLENIENKYKEFKANKGLGNGKEYVKNEVQNYADKKRYGDKAGDVQQQRKELNKTKQELTDAQEALNKAKADGVEGDKLKTYEDKVADIQGKLDGYKKGSTKYTEAKETFDKKVEGLEETSAEYKKAQADFDEAIKGENQKFSEYKKNNTTKAQAKAKQETEAKAKTEANKQEFEKTKNEYKSHKFEVDENGNGVETWTMDNGVKCEVKYEGYAKVSKKMTDGANVEHKFTYGEDGKTHIAESSKTADSTRKMTDKSGVKKETKTTIGKDKQTTSKTTTYEGMADGEKITYEQTYKPNSKGTIENIETYTVGDVKHTYVNGELTGGSELSFAQRQLLKYNAKHYGSAKATTIDSSLLYAQQAAALNANRY